MLLPFVREVFADAEKTASFTRLVSQLKASLQQLEGGSGDGAGLGLAITRGIIEAHAGSVEAISNDGGGATFVLRLPVR